MKTTRRLLCALLALTLVLALAGTAFAAGGNSITVKNAKAGETYKIYKMLDLTVDATQEYFSYTLNTDWQNFFTNGGPGADYVDVSSNVVTWNGNKTDAASMEAFGKAAAAWAVKNNKNTAGDDITPKTDGDITFNSLDNGYYLITSTNGTLAIVDTTPTNPAPEITEKNVDPSVKKQIRKAANGTYGDGSIDAQIGDTVYYQATITAQKGSKNLVFHDKMETGLTLGENTIAVKVNDQALTASTDYTLTTTDLTDGETFQITFTETWQNNLTGSTSVVIEYQATLNKDAEISTETNDNTAWITWGDKGKSAKSTVSVNTYKGEIVKYYAKTDDTGATNHLLDGAGFKLYDTSAGGNLIKVVDITNNVEDSPKMYRIATTGETGVEEIMATGGRVIIQGLDKNKAYYLEESTTPAGFNKLTERVELKLEAGNEIVGENKIGLDGSWKATEGQKTGAAVEIENKYGTELPSTGGMGTTIFYIIGSVLVIGAVVLLVTKKRMSR